MNACSLSIITTFLYVRLGNLRRSTATTDNKMRRQHDLICRKRLTFDQAK
jgi:hypothetical protein